MALLDKLKKRIQPTDVGALERTLVAGQTGRTQQEAGPAASGIGAQIAQQQAQAAQAGLTADQLAAQQKLATQGELVAETEKTQLKGLERGRETALADIAAQGQMAAAQRTTREEQASAALEAQASMFTERVTNTYAEILANLASERNIAEQDIFYEYRQAMEGLDADKAAAELEQLSHLMALADKQYVEAIQRIGREQGLREEMEFQVQAQETIMSGELEILKDTIDFKRVLNADDREFQREVSKINIDEAMKLANLAAREKAYINTIEGITDISVNTAKWYAGQSTSTTPGSTEVTNTREWDVSAKPGEEYV